MKIILYSNAYNKKNKDLDEYLFKFLNRSNPKFVYIPSQAEGSDKFFDTVKDYYKEYGIEDFHTILPDKKITLKDLEELVQSSVLFLTGGNAFYYLKHLRMTGLLDYIDKFVANGGVLLAENAGANIVTPNIIASTIPHRQLDANSVGLKDLKGLNLVDFEFVPHYDETDEEFTDEILNYSLQNDRLIYAVPDYSGIVVSKTETSLIGDIVRFHKGKKFYIKNN